MPIMTNVEAQGSTLTQVPGYVVVYSLGGGFLLQLQPHAASRTGNYNSKPGYSWWKIPCFKYRRKDCMAGHQDYE